MLVPGQLLFCDKLGRFIEILVNTGIDGASVIVRAPSVPLLADLTQETLMTNCKAYTRILARRHPPLLHMKSSDSLP